MGVYIEPPANVVGTDGAAQHYVFRTQPEGARSGPGDTDLVSYSLHKYPRLAAKGNPTALLPLYAPADAVITTTPLGEELRALAPKILSRAARLTLPMPDAERERVLRVKRGEAADQAEVLAEVADVQAQVEDLLATGRTPLPDAPDRAAISEWAVSAHRRHWGW